MLDLPLPSADRRDEIDVDKLRNVYTTEWPMDEGEIAIVRKGKLSLDTALSKKAAMIIGEYEFDIPDVYSVKLPDGKTPREAYVEICNFIRKKYHIPCISLMQNHVPMK